MAFWAAAGAIVLYLGYRWYSNRSASNSSSSSTDSGSVDTSSLPDSGVTNSLAPNTDTTDPTQPPDSTTPGTKVTTGELNPSSGSGTTSTTEPKSGHKKKLRPKKKEATHHDHKQGTHHTQHKKVHVHHAKSPHSHAPHKKPKVHSGEKAATTKNVAKPAPVVTSGGNLRGAARPAPAVKTAPRKIPPAPVHHPEPAKKAKPPLRKRTRA